MRRQDKEIKEQSIIQDILERSGICRLGLIDNNEAYIVPVNYAYMNNVIYFHSAKGGRKIDLIKKNNRVSFEIEYISEIIEKEKPCDWTTRYRSLMGTGIVEFEDEPIAKKQGLDIIMRKFGAAGDLVYDEANFSRLAILKLKILTITGKQSGIWK